MFFGLASYGWTERESERLLGESGACLRGYDEHEHEHTLAWCVAFTDEGHISCFFFCSDLAIAEDLCFGRFMREFQLWGYC